MAKPGVDRWWLRVYLQLAPVGALITASIISGIARAWPPWGNREDLEFFAVLVTLGLACYGALIWTLELVGVAMLWAYSRYKDWRATARLDAQRELAKDLLRRGVEVPPELLAELGLETLDPEDIRDKQPV